MPDRGPEPMSADRPSLRCLVTGAGRGIGRAVAERLAADGHRVALLSRTEADLRELADELASSVAATTLVLPADATADGAAEAAVEAVVAAWGGLDVLVLNAGEGVAASIARTDDALWARMLDLNLTSPFRFLRAAVPALAEHGSGRVVVIASTAALEGAPYIAAYAAAKHGVLGLVRAAAAELGPAGVTVNAVCPAYVDTPMTQRSLDAIVERTGRSRDEALAAMLGAQPRLVRPSEVADAVARLVDDPAANGTAVRLDGTDPASEGARTP